MQSYSSSLFSHDASTKTLVSEASTLQLRRFDRLYQDACDVGLELFNEKTESTSRWYLEETIRQEGDVIEWVLKPCGHNLSDKQLGYRMVILND